MTIELAWRVRAAHWQWFAMAAVVSGCGSAVHAPAAPAPAIHAEPAEQAEAREEAPLRYAEDPVPYVFGDPDRREQIDKALPLIDPLIEAEIASQGLVGVSFGLVVDGELVYAKGYGVQDLASMAPATAQTIYRIGSLTKSFTALALLDLRDRGVLALDDPLSQYLPEAANVIYPTKDSRAITLRQVMTHTSGFPRVGNFNYTAADANPTEADVVGSLIDLRLDTSPGTSFQYSNLGYSLLGIVAARASGQPYRDVIQKRILEPLGMTSTVWDPESVSQGKLATAYEKKGGKLVPTYLWRLGASEASGGLFSSVDDMARYVAFQLSAYPPRSDADAGPVGRSSVREAHEVAMSAGRISVVQKGERLAASADSYGFGWGVAQTCDFAYLVGHSGGTEGFSSQVWLLPEYGLGAIALTNSADAELGPASGAVLKALVKRAELTRRHPDPASLVKSFELAMQRLLAVYNHWDEAAYRAMLAKGRAPLPAEQDELASYHRLHGPCTGYEPLEIKSSRAASFNMKCERGSFEMQVSIDDAEGLITGFSGTSRDIAVPKKAEQTAKDVVSLLRAWRGTLFKKRWIAGADEAKTAEVFERARLRSGTCTVDSYARRYEEDDFVLKCERGPNLLLHIRLDSAQPERIARMSLRAESSGACPGGGDD